MGRFRSLAVTAVLLSMVSIPARGQDDALRSFEGVWRYAEGRAGQARVDQAVARAVDDLPFFLERIAHERVRARVGPYRAVRFELSGNELSFTADDWGPVTTRINGPPVRVRDSRGTMITMQQTFTRGRLIQMYRHPSGVQRNVFTLSDDGQWLFAHVRVTSSQLPDPVSYQVRYRNATPSRSLQASTERTRRHRRARSSLR